MQAGLLLLIFQGTTQESKHSLSACGTLSNNKNLEQMSSRKVTIPVTTQLKVWTHQPCKIDVQLAPDPLGDEH